MQFYRLQINTARAAEARAYLDRRGLAPATRERFEIGYAPDGRTALLDHLKAKGFAPALLAEAGLVGMPQDGGSPYDRFRGRITFPIRDARGRAIGFGARALSPGQEPKYLNSPETPLFDKGRTLYNIAPARAAAGKSGELVVCEGYMDAIALAEAGIDHVVAPLGTAITETQLDLMWRIAPEPVVALDGDAAGQAAAQRLIDLALPLLAPGRALRFAMMPAGQDPDDIVRAGGAAAMQALIAASLPMVDLIWTRETDGVVLDSPERRAALDGRLRATSGAHRRSRPARALSGRDPQPPRHALRAAAASRPPGPPGPGRATERQTRRSARRLAVSAAPATRASPLARATPGIDPEARIRECAILAGCLNNPGLLAGFEERLERMPFSCADLGAIRDALLSARAASPEDAALRAGVAARLGHDPMPDLLAPGQVRANPHLRPGAGPELAARAIEEELTRHAAIAGWRAELIDAARELTAETAESVGWRLRDAADAAHLASVRPISESAEVDAEAEEVLSAGLQDLLDRQIWKKPRKP